MARKAVRLERTGALTPRDRMWAAIRALGCSGRVAGFETFSAVEVHLYANRMLRKDQRAADMTIDAVVKYLESLAAAKYVTTPVAEPERGREHRELRLYRLLRDTGIDAPRVGKDGQPTTLGRGNELMWTALKVLKDFDAVELVMACGRAARDEDVVVNEKTAAIYCMWLVRAGYLACTVPALGGTRGSKARYRFVATRNTGPRPPVVNNKTGEVVDGNTGAVVYTHSKGDRECQSRT